MPSAVRAIGAVVVFATAASSQVVSFEESPAGRFGHLNTAIGTWKPTAGKTIINDKYAKSGKRCLQLTGGKKSAVTLEWLDEASGGRVHYKDVPAGEEVYQGTWQGHYWIVVNKKGKALGIYETPDKDGVIIVK